MNATTSAFITHLASTTGYMVTDFWPFFVYLFGSFVGLVVITMILRGAKSGIRKVVK